MSPAVLADLAFVAVIGLAGLGAGFLVRPGPISRKLRADRIREARAAAQAGSGHLGGPVR